MGSLPEREIQDLKSPGRVIQRLTCRHIENIRKLAGASFETRWSDKDFAYFLAHERGVCLGLYLDGCLKAYLLGLELDGELDIISVATDPEERRRGIAQQLLKQALAWVERATLEVAADNYAAIGMYRKFGFEVSGLRYRYYDGKRDAFRMTVGSMT